MCPPSAARFVARHLSAAEVTGRRLLEVGAHDPERVLRRTLEPWGPADYIGTDIVPGAGVDTVCSGEQLLQQFGPESFDVVVSTEVLEHVQDWRAFVHNIKAVLRDQGVLVATTRSPGFEFHGYPLDFWRYGREDISTIFGDLEIEVIGDDTEDPPGVFFRARRRGPLAETDLKSHRLYSVIRRRPTLRAGALDVALARCMATGNRASERLLPQPARDGIRAAINHASRRAAY